MRRFENFTDDEVYVLSRQTIISSFEIICGGKYSKNEQVIHEKLMNELVKERKIRDIR